MPQVVLRPMREDDVPVVSDIGTQSYRPCYYESDESFYSKWLGYPKGCYVATLEKKVVGYAITFPFYMGEVFALNSIYTPFLYSDCHYFHDVCVSPLYRGRGYAKRLIRKVWNTSVHPKCLVAVNNSKKFWNQYGFKETKKIKYGSSTASYMECV